MESSNTIQHNLPAILPAKQQYLPQITGAPSAQEMMVYQTWAKTAFESQMYKHIGKEQGIMMIILAAREFNIPPAMALNGGLKIINGQVEMSARIMESMIRRAGHHIDILELTDEKCVLKGMRCDNGQIQKAEFTIEQARKAGLIKDGGGWKKWAEDMLYARALSRLARRLFADVIGVGYVQGEISGNNDNVSYNETENVGEIEENRIDELLKYFPEEDHEVLIKFLDAISSHYKWSPAKTIQQCIDHIDDTKLKFNSWKVKNAQ